jgi:hypothetical protein
MLIALVMYEQPDYLKKKWNSFSLQVIYSAIYWLCIWAVSQKPILHVLVAAASQLLTRVAMEFYTQIRGW